MSYPITISGAVSGYWDALNRGEFSLGMAARFKPTTLAISCRTTVAEHAQYKRDAAHYFALAASMRKVAK